MEEDDFEDIINKSDSEWKAFIDDTRNSTNSIDGIEANQEKRL